MACWRRDEFGCLLTFPNVLVTSYQAFLTVQALGGIAHVTVSNLLSQVGWPEGTLLM